jgi:ubiquinone/menaquinone biosynthesis C-methylase UbiE
MEGLRPINTLVDFGCGNGRLAIKVIPALNGGTYIGIDISDTFLKKADQRIRGSYPLHAAVSNGSSRPALHFRSPMAVWT